MRKPTYGLLLLAIAAPAFAQKTIDIEGALQQAEAALRQVESRYTAAYPDRQHLDTTLQAARLAMQNGEPDQAKINDLLKQAQGIISRVDQTGVRQNLELLAQNKDETVRALQAAKDAVFQVKPALTFGGASYEGGSRALDEHRYEDAIHQFDAVINVKSTRADGALYWKAYALDKAGRKDEALAAIAKLRQDYPQSRWLNDAQALESTVKQGSGQPVSAAAETNEDLKLMAINSLMNADAERAIPLLEGILKGNSAPRVKERALFVLTQSKAPRASQLLIDYAKGAGNPDLQARAIRYLGMSGTPESQQQLGAIYAASTDLAVKRDIIRSLMMSRAADQLFTLARTEKEPSLRLEAIRQLGAMSHANDKLLELAKSEKDPAVRGEVVRSLAMNRETPVETILQFYASETDAKIRRDLVNGLANRADVKPLVDLARKETDPAMKKMMVQRLSMSKQKEATDYMMELLK